MESNNNNDDDQDQVIHSGISNEDFAQWFNDNDIGPDRLRAISEIIDDQNKIFEPGAKPILVQSDNYSGLKIPKFEYLRKTIGIK